MQAKCLLILALIAGVGLADINMVYPKQMTFTEGYLDTENAVRYMQGANLGRIAPGQTLRVIIDRRSASALNLPGEDYLWNYIEIASQEDGWVSGTSPAPSSSLLSAYLTVPKGAQGMKPFYLMAKNIEGESGLRTPEKVPLQMSLDPEVFDYLIEEGATYYAEAARPRDLKFSVKSYSIAPDSIRLEAAQIPSRWSEPTYTDVEPLRTNGIALRVTPMEEGLYGITIRATRVSDTADTKAFGGKLRVLPTIESKFKACSEGFSVTSLVLQPVYSLMGFIGSF